MFVLQFFQFLNDLKLYHWSTTSYPRHKASDDCFSSIQSLMDKFVEIYIGKYNRNQILSFKTKVVSVPVTICNDQDAKNLVIGMIQYLENLKLDTKADSDLINIRDEMIGVLNQTLYLFSLS